MEISNSERCATCYGEGAVGSTHGPQACPDCEGIGFLPSATVLTERRLRELERVYARQGGQVGQDVQWLATEVRRAHHALVQILAASQEADESDAAAAQIRGLANSVLNMYRERD
ncbi:MAG: hypothetical protein OEZ06_26250 [Myxococcales bacterium]|nr:hypothetical protein [Myxococcales bacterium]